MGNPNSEQSFLQNQISVALRLLFSTHGHQNLNEISLPTSIPPHTKS